ncbi:energy transducer TonB [Burkholderia cepacia]|uniref:energy transducer TonB n=1 Tax=Burkholderia cepacia TaxID=292 RepID=UPI002AB65AA9|nr:TonB family protein [Burkholderia cepacia]
MSMLTTPRSYDALDVSSGAPAGCARAPSERCADALATGAALVLHVAALLFLLGHPPQFSLAPAGRPVSGNGVRVTLVAAPARSDTPQPRSAKPAPVEQPRRAVARHPPVLTAPGSHRMAAPSPAQNVPASEKPVQPVEPESRPAADTAPAPVAPALNLPGAQAVRNVANVACRIDKPAYPASERRMGHEGTTVLSITIDTSGQIERADVTASSGFGALDAAAQRVLLAAKCDPYLDNGTPVSVHATQRITFSALDR